ncbi:MAG: LLM class F420-dependent oxidoreductase [Minwuia sp.]|uniref:LLM class F420-dependent oxidoreductase n=1 Tax=Minwuia sp. TaxID=2493630 RepID=UPI003A8482F2
MKFGMRYCNTGAYTDPVRAVELAEAAEAAGFESLWTVEHTIVPKGYAPNYPYAEGGKMAGGAEDIDLPDPLIWMAWVAARTTRIKLATGILILPQHNPVHVAKQVATLDHMAGGRIILGIGVGWMPEEFEILGADFATRGPRTDDAIRALRALWRDSPAEHHGDYINFGPTYCEPRPANRHVPIVVGGHSKAAARRAGRLGDGFFPARGAPAELIALAKESAREAGRNPGELEITVSMPDDPADLKALAAAGVDRVTVPVTSMAGLFTAISSPEDALTWKDRIAEFA